jgi:hypothetical protein
LRSSLAFQVLPSVGWMLLKNLLRPARPGSRVVCPGVCFGGWDMPQSPIPYERIYHRRFKQLQGE